MSFEYKDYRDGGRTKEMTLGAGGFLRRFTRHLVPKGFRRIRYYGLLTGPKGRIAAVPGAPQRCIGKRQVEGTPHTCRRCGQVRWRYHCLYLTRRACIEGFEEARRLATTGIERFSLPPTSGCS